METIKPSDLQLSFSSEFFFDTNIWLLLYGKVADYQKNDQKAYSNLFNEILTRKSPIFITSMIISEFANVLLRLEFSIWKGKNRLIDPDYKKNFVGTDEYKKAVIQISSSINRIISLPNIVRIPDNFNSANLNEILLNFKIVDFNDAYIAYLVNSKNLILVTNDADFKKINLKGKLIINH